MDSVLVLLLGSRSNVAREKVLPANDAKVGAMRSYVAHVLIIREDLPGEGIECPRLVEIYVDQSRPADGKAIELAKRLMEARTLTFG